MSSRQWFRWSLGSLTVAAIAWGCQDASRLTAPQKLSPTRIAFDASSPPALQGGTLLVCKDTPPGTSGHFEIDAFFLDGSGRSLGPLIASGTCHPIVTSGDPTIAVFEALDNGDPGWHLVSVTRITDGGTQELVGAGTGEDNEVNCTIDDLHGCILVFHNQPNTPPPLVCTDVNATNYGGPLPCVFLPPTGKGTS